MKILLFYFFNLELPLYATYDHFYRWFCANLPQDKVEIKFLLYEKYYNENLALNLFENIHIEPLTDSDMKYIFDENLTFQQIYKKIHFQKLSKIETDKLRDVYKSKFGDWIPDIIVGHGYFSTNIIWRNIFPSVLCLTQDNSIFSRPPFERTLVYEPFNHVIKSFPLRFKNIIINKPISKKDNLKLNNFKKDITKLIDKHSKIKSKIKYYKKKFKKLVLLPLSGDEAYTLFNESLYGSSLKMVDVIMSKIPKNIGVFVTQHDYVLTFNVR
ncbi:hypothetical protein IJ818_03600 [bacterium]|nr:hypothetical protein [bacterium]